MQYTQETNVFCLWPSSAFYEQFVHRITLLIQVSWQKALLSVKEALRATRTAAQSLVRNLLDQSAACDAVNYLYSVTCMLNCSPDLNPISLDAPSVCCAKDSHHCLIPFPHGSILLLLVFTMFTIYSGEFTYFDGFSYHCCADDTHPHLSFPPDVLMSLHKS